MVERIFLVKKVIKMVKMVKERNLVSFINEFNIEPIIKDNISLLSEEDKEYLKE